MASETERHERERTIDALQTLTRWGQDPGTDGGENIIFSLARQGAPSDAFLASGDCTPFTPHGARGTLHGQPAGDTGAPVVYIDDFSGTTPTVDQIPCTFAFDLNEGRVTLQGSFPGRPPVLHFGVEFLKSFDAEAGENMLFCSRSASDDAGYVIVVQLVGAS